MILTVDIGDRAPKRGDIVQTNVGDKRERTCMIIRVHRIRHGRYKLLCERWWQLEAEFLMRLFESAERSGGQRAMHFFRYTDNGTLRTSVRQKSDTALLRGHDYPELSVKPQRRKSK